MLTSELNDEVDDIEHTYQPRRENLPKIHFKSQNINNTNIPNKWR